MELGYALSSEEHSPDVLVRTAAQAEEAGFTYALISDHIHPWIDSQRESAFVWSVIGGIAQATERLRLGTGVTCPLIRIHPAIIAHAAATCAALMPGRFFLGVGTGENLNEHVLGDRWPAPDERLEMLEEAIELMRTLWKGETTTARGKHYTVENLRIYSLPDEPPDIAVAAAQPQAAKLAGRLGDALISVAPDEEVVEAFEEAGGRDKPRYGQLHVCVAGSEEEARRTAHEIWPNAGIEGALTQELPLPAHFEHAAEMVGEEDVAATVVCEQDASAHLERIKEFADAGFTHVYVHQVGPDQQRFFELYEQEVLPELAGVAV
jgi:coenzyme F420-dependent glucose-6-phosphate dehydrogenase